MLYAAGEKGVAALKQLHTAGLLSSTSTYVVAAPYQYMDDLRGLPLDHLVIPESAIGTPEKCSSLSPTGRCTLIFGIPTHNPSIAELRAAYEKWDVANKPSLETPSIVVMLPGDAPLPNGQMLYFTQDSADELVRDVVSLWHSHQQHQVLIHNGHRTGKHDPLTGNVICDHIHKGETPEREPDCVSAHFIKRLHEEKVPYSFFNFTFEEDGKERRPRSAFHPLLYLAQQSPAKNIFIIPGESVSMLSQIPLYVEAAQAIVYFSSSMNESHKDVCKAAFNRGYLSFFDEMGKVITPAHPSRRKDDAKQAAEEILKGFKDKFGKDTPCPPFTWEAQRDKP